MNADRENFFHRRGAEYTEVSLRAEKNCGERESLPLNLSAKPPRSLRLCGEAAIYHRSTFELFFDTV
jgi:hypothetical protein